MSAAATLHGRGRVPAAAVGAARVPVVRHTAPAPAVSLRRVQVAPAAVDQVHRTSTAVQDATALPVEHIGPALAVCGSWCTSANARMHRAGPCSLRYSSGGRLYNATSCCVRSTRACGRARRTHVRSLTLHCTRTHRSWHTFACDRTHRGARALVAEHITRVPAVCTAPALVVECVLFSGTLSLSACGGVRRSFNPVENQRHCISSLGFGVRGQRRISVFGSGRSGAAPQPSGTAPFDQLCSG